MHKAEFLKNTIIKNGWSKKNACQVLGISDELFETYLSDPYLHDNIVFEICSKLELYPISEVKFSISEECLEYLKRLQKYCIEDFGHIDTLTNNYEIEKQNMETAHKQNLQDQAAVHDKKILSYSEQIKILKAEINSKNKEIDESYLIITDQKITISNLIEIIKLNSIEIDRLEKYKRPSFRSYVKELLGFRNKINKN